MNYHKRNTSIQKRVNILKVKVTMTQNRSIFACAVSPDFTIIRFFTSYSKDKRERETKYGSLSQKGEGQPCCNSLVALYCWWNIFTPLNHRCIQLRKQMKDDDWETPRTWKDKNLLVKVGNGCFPIELCVFVIFFVNSASISAPYMQLISKV